MKKIKNTELESFFKDEKINTLVCSSSFEDRCFAVVNYATTTKFSEALIYQVTDLNSKIIDNAKILSSKINSENCSILDQRMDDPVYSFLIFHASISPIFKDDNKNIVVDITTFTHEGLLMLFRILKSCKRGDDKIFLIYNGANEYSCKEEDRNKKWLTKGVKNVRSILGYPGYSDPSLKNHLIVLFGFERDRTLRLIERYDYDKVSLAFATQEASITKKHQQINEERHKEILSLHSNAEMFNISLTDPETTKGEILEYVSKYPNFNIVLSPMNNKLSTIGAGLAAISNERIQLCYLQANQYNIEGYSEAGNDFYIWSM